MVEPQPKRKLVRDRIPEYVLQREQLRMNVVPVSSEEEFRQLLAEKLLEEALEFQREPSAEELGDISTVMEYIFVAFEFDLERVNALQRGRCRLKGQELHAALVEKAQAFRDDSIIDHLADVREIFLLICVSSPEFDLPAVDEARLRKSGERGSFHQRLVWDGGYLS